MASECEWDPSGRFVITSVSYWRFQSDTGYYVWSFQGKLLQKVGHEKFYQLIWRPRPKSLLKPKDHEKIKMDWKKYQSQFEAEDRMQQSRASDEVLARRAALKAAWDEHHAKFKALASTRVEKMAELRQARPTQMVQSDETVEIFVREDVEILDAQ